MTIALLASAVAMAAPAPDFELVGSYVEGCSCSAPCPCELTGVAMGCEGIGVFDIKKGSFQGKDMSGCRTAYATAPGQYLVLYIDAPTDAKRAAAEGFMKKYFGPFGELKGVHSATIKVTVGAKKQFANVDGGSVMSIESHSVLGMDKMSAMTYSNINSAVHPTVMQSKVVTCSFNDGERSFKLEGSNAYFNPALNSKG